MESRASESEGRRAARALAAAFQSAHAAGFTLVLAPDAELAGAWQGVYGRASRPIGRPLLLLSALPTARTLYLAASTLAPDAPPARVLLAAQACVRAVGSERVYLGIDGLGEAMALDIHGTLRFIPRVEEALLAPTTPHAALRVARAAPQAAPQAEAPVAAPAPTPLTPQPVARPYTLPAAVAALLVTLWWLIVAALLRLGVATPARDSLLRVVLTTRRRPAA